VRSFYIQIGLATLVAVGMSALICFAIISNWDTDQAATFQPVATSLIGLVFSGLVLAVTGVTLVASEYSSGMIRLTMAVTPSRLRVLLAKAIVIAGVAWTIGLVTAFASFLAGYATLSTHQGVPTASVGDSEAQRAIIAAWLTAPLFPLIGVALGAILRSTASAITATLALIFAPGIFGALLPASWQANVLAYLPNNASNTLLRVDDGSLTYLEPAVAIAVILAWILLFFGVATFLIKRRDV
jgi:ABC-2 type transport system permease protein